MVNGRLWGEDKLVAGRAVCEDGRGKAQGRGCGGGGSGLRRCAGMWERLERGEIRRRRARSARTAVRRGITVPEAGDRPRPDLPEGADLLPRIRHIVVLMMENHSYDNYLGMLAGRGDGLPLGPDGTPDTVNYIPNGEGYRAHHLSS